ncbi:traB domain-containing protein-like [Xenia sp. Carnegie-2017]|uniref:traB domain-containing protein-like n=1 Tax=Xenia sp. Carnegie-2017 TaxID=2897299 RepID=UPI001F034B08|nr:traB domain-containing protein-like [Xenia sp. Carnegie-2017]
MLSRFNVNKMADGEQRKVENIMDEKEIVDEKTKENNQNKYDEDSNGGETSDCPSGESIEWIEPEDDELIVIETGDGAPLVGTVETAESYYVVNSHQHHASTSEMQMDESMLRSLTDSRSGEKNNSYDLPDTVTKLMTPYRSTVYVVGTAHFSKSSQEDVRKTINLLQPNVVMVELCRNRVDILKYDEEFLMREVANISFQKLRTLIQQTGVISGIMQVLLLSMSAHITKELGMAPGGEFRAAYQEVKKVPFCQFRLADRPIQITLARAMGALSVWQKIKLAWHLITSKEPISKEDVERCKQKDLLAEMLAEMTGDFPKLYEIIVKERDAYLARSLRLAAIPREVTDPDGGFHFEPTVIVGVVGIGHVQGIIDHWEKDIDVQEIMRIPPRSKTWSYVTKILKATTGMFMLWSCYKIIRWTGILKYLPTLPLTI